MRQEFGTLVFKTNLNEADRYPFSELSIIINYKYVNLEFINRSLIVIYFIIVNLNYNALISI